MNGASRWLDACAGLAQGAASAAANKAGASALASAGYFTVAANMECLLAESSVGCGVDSVVPLPAASLPVTVVDRRVEDHRLPTIQAAPIAAPQVAVEQRRHGRIPGKQRG